MRLSGLVIAAILLVPATLLAQHSSGGGASSGGSASVSSHSGGSTSSASSVSSHTSSASAAHVGSTSAAAHPSSSSKLPPGKGTASPEKKPSRSLLHPFRKPQPVQNTEFKRPAPCLKGRCPVCPPGESRSGSGACAVTTTACAPGLSWNGFACGVPYRFNDCSALANQLEAERRRMQGQSDPGQAVFYRMLRQQYESCLQRYGSPMFGNALLFDSLFDAP